MRGITEGGAVPIIDLNIIRVGLGDAAEWTIKAALAETSRIFAPIGLTLGVIRRYDISLAEAGDMSVLEHAIEAAYLTAAWTAPGDAPDIFVVSGYDKFAQGISPEGGEGGPCQKDTCDFMTGAVVELSNSHTGAVLAHEVCHYLGLEHDRNRNNLMHPSTGNERRLTETQVRKMLGHCFVKP